MKTSYFTVVLTLTCLLGWGIGGHAQDAGRVIVKVPFEFIAGGTTLPAGTYTIGRLSPAIHPALLIDNKDAGLFAVVLPSVPKVFLSKVGTPAGVYTILTPRAATKLAQMNDHGATSSSGTN